jgi:hypothetical protein
LRQYGITEQDYQDILDKQNNKCPICFSKRNSDHRSGRLDVDHEHNTGKVRGLLCGNCNKAIGLLGDDPARARRLAEYLQGG